MTFIHSQKTVDIYINKTDIRHLHRDQMRAIQKNNQTRVIEVTV